MKMFFDCDRVVCFFFDGVVVGNDYVFYFFDNIYFGDDIVVWYFSFGVEFVIG